MNAHHLNALSRRRRLVTWASILLSSLAAVCCLPYGAAQTPEAEGREVEDTIPKHLPLKVRVKRPEKLKDSKNEGWIDDIEIEVTNTGTKPIYFLNIALSLPDVMAPNGLRFGFRYRYGRIQLADFGEPLQPGDVPLRPGESVTLRPAANTVEGWKRLRGKGAITSPKKLVFNFQEINFGDGTGFLGTSGTPIPENKERSSTAPCVGVTNGGVEVAASDTSPPRLSPDPSFLLTHLSPPVSFVPAFFLPRALCQSRRRSGTFAVRLLGLIAPG